MKRLTSVAVAVGLVVGAASTTWAGQEPYVGAVGEDDQMNTYYLEPKLWAWLHSETTSDTTWRWDGDEVWDVDFDNEVDPAEIFQVSSGIIVNHPEVCIKPQEVLNGIPGPANNDLLWEGELEPTAWLTHGNEGWYKWRINLPKKPRGNINIVVQCGILKDNSYTYPNAIEECAGETGEKLGPGVCTRANDVKGTQVMLLAGLPKVTAVAFPDPSRGVDPFHLTSFKTPSFYALGFKPDGSLKPVQSSHVILDGSNASRISLKACQPESMYVKIPVNGQINGLGETEVPLEAGEEIEVTLQFPDGHPMDIYCNKYSVKLMGLGQPRSQTLVEDEI
jgi:hypothetical protein